LIQASNGLFYGGTAAGGTAADGVVYSINSTGTSFADIYNFQDSTDGEAVYGQMLQGSDGNLYGATDFTVFKVTPGGTFTLLATPDGDPTGLIQANDGNYYFVTTFGSGIYKITASTGVVTKIATAPGYNLYNLVQAADGNLYGTELGGGTAGSATIFQCTLGGSVSAFYTFPSTLYPSGGIVIGPDGQLYGTVGDNTQATEGQFYKVSLAGSYTNLYTLPVSSGLQIPTRLMTASDGNFYAVAQSQQVTRELIQLTPSGTFSQLLTISDIGVLVNPLVQGSDGALYGVGSSGGGEGDGAVYKITLSPALNPPVDLVLGNTSIVQGTSTTLTWSVSGVYGESATNCFATSSDPEWTGTKPTSGQVTLTPAAVGSFTYALTCGGTISNSVTLTVTSNGKVNTTTALAVSANPITIGNTATLTATVKPASGSVVPTGTVVFSVGTTTVGSANLNGSGVATLSEPTTGLAAGTYPVVATYNGSSGFNTSVSSVVNVVLTKEIATSTTVTISPADFLPGVSPVVSATVKPVSGNGVPTGTVVFTVGSTSTSPVALNGSGVASFKASTTGLPEGSYVVVATYSGSSAYQTSSGSATAVVQWPTTVTLQVNPNPVIQGNTATLTATVTRNGNAGIPTGTITFAVGTTGLATVNLSGGTASYSAPTASVAQGTYAVTAFYSGDTNDADATSAPVNVVVN
jgi:hypothetical protein